MSTNAQNQNSKRNVCVIVLGDIGHSPRMQYHVQRCETSVIQYRSAIGLFINAVSVE